MEHDSDSSDEESLALKRRKLASSTLIMKRERELLEAIVQKEKGNKEPRQKEKDDDKGDASKPEKSGVVNLDLPYGFDFRTKEEKIHHEAVDVDSILSLVGASSHKVKTKIKYKRLHRYHDPNLPRRPRSAFKFFFRAKAKEFCDQIISEGKKPTYPRMLQKVSTMWRRLTFEERIPYNELAIEDKIRYNEEMTNYHPRDPDLVFSSDTSDSDFGDVDLSDSDYDLPDDKSVLQDTYKEIFYKIKNSGPKSRFGLNAPKRYNTAYTIYVKMHRKEIAKELLEKYGSAISINLIFDEATSRWKELPKEEKEEYKILERADMARYRRELAEYKKKMAVRKAAMEQAKRDGVEYVEEAIYNYN